MTKELNEWNTFENESLLVEMLQNYISELIGKTLTDEEYTYLFKRLDEIDSSYGEEYCNLVKETRLELLEELKEKIQKMYQLNIQITPVEELLNNYIQYFKSET